MTFTKTSSTLIAGTALAMMFIGSVNAKDYKMSTISLPTPFALNTTFAKIVQKYNKDIKIQINATGAAPRHALDAANGKTDLLFGAPSLMFLMSKGMKMFKKVKNAPKLANNLRAIFHYRIGMYSFGVYEDSGMKKLADIKGKRVFIGPPTGVQKVVSAGFIKAVTGLEMNKDYTAVKLGFSPAMQAFQDRQIDLMTGASNHPDSFFSQIALTNKIRFLGAGAVDLNSPKLKKIFKIPGRTPGAIKPDVYGKNQTNTKPIKTIAAYTGLYCRTGLPEEVVYKMTKTFWEHIDEMWSTTAWAKGAINKKSIFHEANWKFHPGALKYYKEIGLKIPAVAK
ncbi:MAG: TAXI family TRAP transporter solute-binding subunit [Pseudomonadota bacterium]|nr:TAXI family TRAP transporter solute-binding subunit [Pseudomonadota bacterium]